VDTKNSVQTLLDNLESLPTLPEVALNVLKLTSDPDSDAEDLHKIISKDPSLTAKILRVANSSFYGFRSQISTLKMAIVVLGFDETARLVRAFTFLQTFPSAQIENRFDYKDFWLHSIAVSEIIKSLALKFGFESPSEISTGGLLHDIGHLVLASYFENDFIKIIRNADEKDIRWEESEYEIMGFNHCEIGATLAKKWNLPEKLLSMIEYHHSPEDTQDFRIEASLAYIANRITALYGADLSNQKYRTPVDKDPVWNFLLNQSPLKTKPVIAETLEALESDVDRAKDFHSVSIQ